MTVKRYYWKAKRTLLLAILSDTFNFDPENLVRDGLGAFRSQV
ncbi:hypothetical protein F441_12053 [Phytophthora nicotianae CJ01A1]|uniref:Uncharacterized protein n=1 Tax=Phytophthora nicotianae CJ01A1 TaxID=1317063 RepID=W2WR13_PHYNI|nr:hypothetical protein F441_12053 [Phytophthora nicotianae CJ01A1]